MAVSDSRNASGPIFQSERDSLKLLIHIVGLFFAWTTYNTLDYALDRPHTH